MRLESHRYGKARVRVAKILRNGKTHTLKEINVAAILEGDFDSSYTAGDNTKVVPTDTIKNTINVLAKQHLGEEIEPFAIALGEHFLKRYQQVRTARIDIDERNWQRMEDRGKTASAFVRRRQRSEDVHARRLHTRFADDRIRHSRFCDFEIDRLRL